MRVVMLSDHPGDRVAAAVWERERPAVEQDAILAGVQQDRQKARSEGRWLTWLWLWLAVRREQGEARTQHARARIPSSEEEAARAGARGEQSLEDGLRGALLSDEWVLFRGYNGESEIDGLLLGPRGLFAIEVKNVNRTVYIHGDHWTGQKFNNSGTAMGERQPMTNRRGRSPSQQVAIPAAALANWLHRQGQHVTPVLVVLLPHPNAKIGRKESPTVEVMRSVGALLGIVEKSPVTIAPGQQAKIEELIRHDHEHHARRRLRRQGNRDAPASRRPGRSVPRRTSSA
jgi:hypothetical protein